MAIIIIIDFKYSYLIKNRFSINYCFIKNDFIKCFFDGY